MLSVDIYLLITKNRGENFCLAELQTDNTFNVETKTFIKKEKTETIEAKFKTKTWIMLEADVSRDFNCCYVIIEAEFIIIVQKNQEEKLVLVDIKDNIKKQ